MKTVIVNVPLQYKSVDAVFETMLCPDVLRSFHGPGTVVGDWQADDSRKIEFDLDSSGSPIDVGMRVRTRVRQVKDAVHRTVKNSLRLRNLNILNIESTWHVGDDCVVGKANIRVKVPPPFSWIAESFVAMKAKTQMTLFAESIVSSTLTTCY